MTSIGENTFKDCDIQTITIHCKEIGDEWFKGLKSLKEVVLGDEVTSIGCGAFESCSGLTSITIPPSVTSIDNRAFAFCTGLTSVNISDLEAWCKLSFNEPSTNPLYYAHHLFIDGEEIKDLVIPNSVTSIGNSAFAYCLGLTSVTIGNSVTSIGNYAFYGCHGLDFVTIPASVSSIGNVAFAYCSGLSSVTSLIADPFEISSEIFVVYNNSKKVFTSATLYVPYGTKAKYKAVSGWKEFKNIVEADLSQLNVIATTDTNEPFIKVARREGWIGSSDTQMTQSQAEAVTTIGTAFRGNMEIVTLNELEYFINVTKIDVNAFNGCQKMAAIRIPDTITEIDDSAFYNCKALAEFYMPSSVQKVGRWGFAYCTGLKKVTISDLAAWCAIALTGNYSNPLYWSKHLYLNGDEIIDLVIPDGVETIENYVFWGGNFFKSVAIPSTVKTIKAYSFAQCYSLTSIAIPSSVTSIHVNPFMSCRNLTSIVVESDNKYYDSRNNCNAIIRKSDNLLITGCQTTKIPSAVTTLNTNAFNGQTAFTTFDIPSSITKIGINAFENCSNLTSVSIPAHVTTIGTGVFLYCTKLTKVTCHIKEPFAIDSSVFTDNTKNEGTLYVPAGTKAKYEATAGWKEFKNIVEADLSQLNVIATIDTNEPFIKVARREGWIGSSDTQMTQSQAEAVTTIGTAFRGNMEIVTLNELEYFINVTKIDVNAFNGCQKMTAIRIPDTITEIGDSAFYYCKALTEFYMPSSVQKVGVRAFAYCTGLKKVTISDLAAWSAIAFTGNLSTPLHYAKHLYLNGEEVIDLVVPDGVTTINSYAFWGGSSIKTVSIPATVKSIKIYSFARCSSLKSIIIPSTVTSISTNPFIGCSGLTSIVIEGDNKYYDSRNNCNAIIRKSDNLLITGCQTTKIPSAVTTLNTNAFNGQTAFTTFDIPSSITKIGINAFENCSNLTSVSIPAHVTTIGTGVFLYCTKLTKVTCHIKEPFAIDSSVFTDNTKNEGTLYVPAGTKAKYEATAGWKEFKNIVELASPEPYALLSDDGKTVTFYYDDNKTNRGGIDINNSNLSSLSSPYGNATSAIFDASLCVTRTNRPFVGSQFVTSDEMVVGLPHTVYRHCLQTTSCCSEGNRWVVSDD